MNQNLRSWIPTALFWVLFAASLGFGRRYPWLDTIWYGALVLVLLGLSAYSLIHNFRHRHEIDITSYQAVPHWLRRFFFDEHEDDQKAEK